MNDVRRGLTLERKQALWAWTFLAVPAVFYVVIRFYPTISAFLISFTEWNLVGEPAYVGVENYVRMAGDPVFWKVLLNTVLYGVLGLPISIVLSFVVAYYLDQVRFMHGFLRALYFIPFLTTAAAMGWVWRWFYQPVPVGIFNLILVEVGFAQQPFLRSTVQALPAVVAPAVWAGLGFQVVIFLAGLRAIPSSYYEAARIDGAGAWRILWEITIPLLRPTLIFLIVISTIGFLRIFDQVFNMTFQGDGGPLNATKPMVLFIYDTAFRSSEMGYATAQTVILFLMLLVITLIQMRAMRQK